MSRIIDLNLLVKDPLIFRDTKGEEYTIPGEISTKFVLKFSKFAQEVGKVKNEEDSLKKLQEIVVEILNLDKSKNITLEFVKERFDDIRYLQAILDNMAKHIREISEDPNSNSLLSTKEK